MKVIVPYSGKVSYGGKYGANFMYEASRYKNEQAIEHVEAASKQTPVDPSTPVSLTILWEVRKMKVSQVHHEQQRSASSFVIFRNS